MVFSPKVSIIIPVYNGSRYLREAIDSALAQTYRNIEVIVVNDGSRDDDATERIALSYGSRIRYISKENGGVATALNRGIQETSGDLFSWLSHDDVYVPNKIERQVEALPRDGGLVILYGDYELIDADSRHLQTVRIPHLEPAEFRFALMTSWPINGCTALVPRECFTNVGLFDETLRTTQDYDLWFRMAERYPFRHLPEVLIRSRIHPEQGTRAMNALCQAETTRLYKHFADRLFLETTPQDSVFSAIAGLLRKNSIEAASFALSVAAERRKKGQLPATIRFVSKSLVYRSRILFLQLERAIIRGIRNARR